jgi:hypothetical protein
VSVLILFSWWLFLFDGVAFVPVLELSWQVEEDLCYHLKLANFSPAELLLCCRLIFQILSLVPLSTVLQHMPSLGVKVYVLLLVVHYLQLFFPWHIYRAGVLISSGLVSIQHMPSKSVEHMLGRLYLQNSVVYLCFPSMVLAIRTRSGIPMVQLHSSNPALAFCLEGMYCLLVYIAAISSSHYWCFSLWFVVTI